MTTNRVRLLGATILAAVLAAGAAARADDPSDQARIQALQVRLARDEAQARALQGQLDADGAGTVQVADLFGPSDEEKAAAAAAAQREQTQDANIAQLNQRAGDIEDSIRRLTGEIEVLQHRLDQYDARLDTMRKEFEYKLCAMSAQQLGASTTPGDDNAVPCSGGASGTAAPATPSQQPAQLSPNMEAPTQGVTHLAPPPGVLGTLPQGTTLPQPQQGADATMASPGAPAQMAGVDPRAQFDAAMNMLARQQYDEATSAFRNFADANPKDPLAAQALYWLGDVAYVQKDYAAAARAFVEELKKYPASPRGAESMLKLGQSLLGLNQKDEGCTALKAIAQRYPSASRTVLAQADAVRKAGGCRR